MNAQGMPTHIETALKKIISSFMWDDDSTPRIASDTLNSPIHKGGLDLLDIEARNKAIDIIWLKKYLNFSAAHPMWATVTDIIIQELALKRILNDIEYNPFLQCWNIPTPSPTNSKVSNNIKRMLKVARKYKTNLAVICLTPQLNAQLPAWHHISTIQRPMQGATTKCLIRKHRATSVADFLKISNRIRNATTEEHGPSPYCHCQDCNADRLLNCLNPHACATEAAIRLQQINPK